MTGTVDPGGGADDALVAEVVRRVAADHAHVPADALEALVRESLAPTAGATVTIYRAVLAERRVRARLRGSAHSAHPVPNDRPDARRDTASGSGAARTPSIAH